MTSTNINFLGQAKQAIQAQDKRSARHLLQQAIRQDPGNFKAWAWLAAVTTSPAGSLNYARQAAKLAPEDPFVHKVKQWAERRASPAVQTKSPLSTEEHTSPARWQKYAIWGSLAALLIILIMLGSITIWSLLGNNGNQTEETAVAQVRNPSTNEAASQAEPDASLPARSIPVETATPQPFIPAKNIAGGHSEKSAPRATWTPTPIPTKTPVPTPTALPTFVSPTNAKPATRPFGVAANERWVDVDLTRQRLVAYEGDIPVLSTLISSGTWDHPTVTGQFRIWLRYESQTMDGRRLGYNYYLENVPFVMYFYQDYALHGTFWHNNFGSPMSHGCVNMETGDAGWLFEWSTLGTLVNVHY